MKNRKYTLAFALAAFVLLGATNLSVSLIKATPATIDGAVAAPISYSPPTTLDLNDYTEAEIRNYYSSLNSLSSSEKQGTNLLKNLKPILYNMRYTSYDTVWKTSAITERDWSRSPASSIGAGTYDASTGIVTGYKYDNNGAYDDPYLIVLYRNDNGTHDIKASSTHQGQTNALNREHAWPQSRGFKAASGASGPAGTDIHHLILADSKVNQLHHNNNAYGDVINVAIDENENGIGGNKRGTGAFGSTSVFEPIDEHKGDIARACFYMAARYNNWAGISGAITDFEPFLILNDNINVDGSAVGSTDTTPASYGTLTTLLEWNRLDPVNEYEIHRNNLIQRNFQQNRNPFIDFPEWAEYIWGNDQSNHAKPTTDYCTSAPAASTDVTGVSLNRTSATMSIGSTLQLTATVFPLNAANKNITWQSTNNAVATVSSDGLVSGLTNGTTTIKATTVQGGFVASCAVTVTTAPTLSSITVSDYETSLKFMGTYSISNMVVTAHYSNGGSDDVTDNAIIEIPNESRLGNQSLSVSYSENSITKFTTYSVFVTNNNVLIGGIPALAPDLFISEYIEGSSNNKYLEIYNGTGKSVDLSDYKLQLFTNGSSSATGGGVVLSETIAHNSTIVYKNNNAALTLPSGVNAIANAALNYNGDDAIGLYKISTGALVDIFGVIGEDPGTEWTGGEVSTVNKTLVRKPSIYQGVTVNPTTFDPSVEWIQFNQDTVSNLGSHSMTATVPGITKESQAIAWAEYFLEVTGEYCENLNGSSLAGTTWTELGREYGYMDPTTKALFGSTTSDPDDEGVAGAKARYYYLVTKYGILMNDNFMRDGSNNIIFSANQRKTEMNNYEIVPMFIIIFSTMLISASSIRLYRKIKQH